MVYTAFAFLRGSQNIAVRDAQGQVGIVDGEGRFRRMPEGFEDAAIQKYGYQPMSDPVAVDEEGIRQLQVQALV